MGIVTRVVNWDIVDNNIWIQLINPNNEESILMAIID